MDIIGNGYLRIIISSVTVYLCIVIAIRLFGKKELAQLSVIDLVFILLISNAVQNAMVGPDSSLSGGLVAAGALFVTNYLFKFVLYRFPDFGKLIQGEPLLLIYRGRCNKKNMAAAKLSMDELTEAAREHGVARLEEVDLAMLEIDGNISILSHEFARKTTRKRKAHKVIAKTQV
jgi:uncharacterized membrane protein YcaP (DUF421 family)